MHRLLPPGNWLSRRRWNLTPVNLDRIQEAIDAGIIDPNLPITMKTLREAKVVNKIGDGVKLLARVQSTFWTTIDFGREKTLLRNPSRYMWPVLPERPYSPLKEKAAKSQLSTTTNWAWNTCSILSSLAQPAEFLVPPCRLEDISSVYHFYSTHF